MNLNNMKVYVKMGCDVMIDIETLGTDVGSIILTIGAVKFDKRTFNVLSTFHEKISIKSCKDIGMTMDDETVKWWEKRPVHIREDAWSSGPRVNIKNALELLTEWVQKGDCVDNYWSQGILFDFLHLEDAFKRVRLLPPWKFWQIRDCRTVLCLFDIKLNNATHNALEDCLSQVKCLSQCSNKTLIFR